MRRHREDSGPLSDDPIANLAASVAEAVTERTHLTGKLLQQLALAVAANEKAQRKFRTAVLIRLSKIETIVQMIHGAQIVETQRCIGEKVDEHAKAAEECISQKSKELLLEMVKYVYDEPETPNTRRRTPRKQSE